jgi:hypothetical protein
VSIFNWKTGICLFVLMTLWNCSRDFTNPFDPNSILDVSPNGERICIGSGAYVYTYGYANYWKVTTESE